MTSTAPDPALPPPPGAVSNFVDPPSLLYYGDVTAGVCTATVTVIFLLRCYVRIRYKRAWNLEDCLIFLSWVGTVAFMGILAASMPRAGGKHLWDTTKAEAKEFAYWFHVSTCEYAASICMTKVAILWLYRRAFSSRKGSPFEIACFLLIGINIVYYSATLLAKIFECTPIEKIYNPEIPGVCISIYNIMISDGIFNIITDFIILLMPAVTIYRLQMGRWKQLIVLMIFTFGLCAPIFSIVGFYVRLQHGKEVDVSWNLPQIVFWGGAEITTGTICVCLPELGLLFNSHAGLTHQGTATPSKSRSTPAPGSKTQPKKRFSRHFSRRSTLVCVNPYMDLDEEQAMPMPMPHPKKLSTDSSTLAPSLDLEKELPVPPDAVHVRYDVQVQTTSQPNESWLLPPDPIRQPYPGPVQHGYAGWW